MSAGEGGPLRVALLYHSYGASPAAGADLLVHALAQALAGAGHRPTVLSSHEGATSATREGDVRVIRTRRLGEGVLRARGFTGPLTHIPGLLGALSGGGYELAHSFSPPDALAARLWRRGTRRPVVFTCTETLRREHLADRRLRLALLAAAAFETDAVVAASEAARVGLERWLAVDAPTLAAQDAAGHERLYRGLLSSPGRVRR